MSEPARSPVPHEPVNRASPQSGPLRDWLAAMRATLPETKSGDPAAAEPVAASAPSGAEARPNGWAPRLVVSAPHGSDGLPEEPDDEVAEIVAENMMLKAKLRLEADRRDELQLLLAQEIRELRAHVTDEVARFEDLRAERDLWKARCEALMQPLFHGGAR